MKKDQHNTSSEDKKRYILTLYRESDYSPVWNKHVSKHGFYSLLIAFILFIIIITTLVFAFTPLKELLPGFPKKDIVEMAEFNAMKLDSLERQMTIKDQYFDNIKKIIQGEPPLGFQDTLTQDTIEDNMTPVEDNKIPADSVLRTHIENEEKAIKLIDAPENHSLSYIHILPPVHGLVTGYFNPKTSHFGIDIVSKKDEPIVSVMKGTVTLASWTMDAGYIINIQHDNNIISVYKHMSQLLKKQGDFVEAGEVIGIIGNSGEYSSGPHLHFELWQEERPIDPETVIDL